MKKLSLVLCALFITVFANAQHPKKCGTDFINSNYFKNHPGEKVNQQKLEKNLQKTIQHNYTLKEPEQLYTIPLVIHVLHLGEDEGTGNNISDAQIFSGITQLNEAFSNTNNEGIDMNIQFELAKQTPNGESTNGILRVDASNVDGYAEDGIALQLLGADEVELKNTSKWDNNNYYNIWIVSEIEGNDGGYGTQGFAYFPGASATYDGTIIMNTSWGNIGTVNGWNNQGTTLIHELGHSLGLYHTFHVQGEGSDTTAAGCVNNVSCTTQGDFCCDTDPHKASSSNSCKINEINECTGNIYGNVVRNFMDYSKQECQEMFSADQKDRMRATLEGSRKLLLSSKALKEPIVPCETVKLNANCTPTTEADGLSAHYAGIGEYRFFDAFNISSFADTDGGYLNETNNCAATAFVNPDSTYKLKILAKGNVENTNYIKAWIDYNNDNNFSALEEIYDNQIKADIYDSINVTIPNYAETDKFLKLRVLVDLNPISDACHDPQYGQAEDYSVYIYTVNEITSTKNINNYKNLIISPNPTSKILNIQFESDEKSNYHVLDLQGRIVQIGAFKNTNLSHQIDVSSYKKGVYILSVQNSQGSVNRNFVVK